MKANLKIPYGVADFKTIRNERLYYIDKTGYIPLLEQAGRFLARYRADKGVPSLARGTILHQIVFQFRGDNPVRIEQVAEEQM